MLKQLSIVNFALIKEATLNFDNGFSVITGETGSGKSILLGALNLILGNRADLSVIRDTELKTSVEAEFEFQNDNFKLFFEENDIDYFQTTIIRREINGQGRSRAFVNDVPVQLNVLKLLAEQLVNIHSQYHTIELRNPVYQLELFDALVDLKQKRKAYISDYLNWKKLFAQHAQLSKQQVELNNQMDYNIFQLSELSELKLHEIDYQSISNELISLEKVDEYKLMYGQLDELLVSDSTIVDLLRKGKSILEKNHNPATEAILERWVSLLVESQDLSHEIEQQQEKLESNPSKLFQLVEVNDLFNNMLRKHGVTSQEELIDVLKSFEVKVEMNSNFESRLFEMNVELEQQMIHLEIAAKELHDLRLERKTKLENDISQLLEELKLKDTQVEFQISLSEKLHENGSDDLVLLFSPNKGMSPKPIEKAASGGELSRFMLVIQLLLSKKVQLPTIIFDEIDTGVSGDVAHRVGKMLKVMGEEMQVLAITHLPQVAAQGKYHFKVQKNSEEDETLTRIDVLNESERITEIAQLMSGTDINEAALVNARALMNQ
jgi:DNA repair protein RecN (Recombination protein N)